MNQQLERVGVQGQRPAAAHLPLRRVRLPTIPQNVVEKRIALGRPRWSVRLRAISDRRPGRAEHRARRPRGPSTPARWRSGNVRSGARRSRSGSGTTSSTSSSATTGRTSRSSASWPRSSTSRAPGSMERGTGRPVPRRRCWKKKIVAAGVVAVIIGPQGLGRWQEMEYHAALQRYIEDRDEAGRRRVRVVPILLPGSREPQLPAFLRGFDPLDFRAASITRASSGNSSGRSSTPRRNTNRTRRSALPAVRRSWTAGGRDGTSARVPPKKFQLIGPPPVR